jgi:hypothetical protein
MNPRSSTLPTYKPMDRVASWTWCRFCTGALLLVICGPVSLQSAPPLRIEIAEQLIASAVAEGVAISIQHAPQDKRALVLSGTLLDDVTIRSMQQSTEAAHSFVARIADRYPLSEDAKDYLTGALIGLSMICEDYPDTTGQSYNPSVLKLIQAFRRGIQAGVESQLITEQSTPPTNGLAWKS